MFFGFSTVFLSGWESSFYCLTLRLAPITVAAVIYELKAVSQVGYCFFTVMNVSGNQLKLRVLQPGEALWT